MTKDLFDFDAEDPVISIGTLARKVGVSVSTVRKYERQGLLIPHRTESKRRLFSMEDLNRVRTIHQMIQDRGLNIEGIRRIQALLPCWEMYPCGEEQRRKCMAFLESTRPCWMEKGQECAARGDGCRNCVVYRFGSLCLEDIKALLHDPERRRDREALLARLRQKRFA